METVDKQWQVSNSGCTIDDDSTGEGGESGASQLKTLASVPLSKEVPIEYSPQPLQSVKEGQVKEVQEEPSICSSGPTAQLQIQHQIQVPDSASRLELSPTSVTQSMSSITSPSRPEQQLQLVTNRNKLCIAEERKQNSPRPKLSSVPMPKTPSDGYNWRKYGQKQVKSPEGSRSYYRCTFSDCYAKKIECSAPSNRVTETVYRSHHNHDPPQKLNCNRENRPAIPIATVSGNTGVTHPAAGVNDLVQSTSTEPLPGMGKMPGSKQQESNGSDECLGVNAKDEYADGPECKKRKRISPDELESLPRPENNAKFVVHAAGDVGISGDGYRWRKYGQKMVKGNPHPRNYYRCTSAGCPIRKHIERAVDSTSALVITYKGGHNHDMPVPRKRHGPKSAPPVSGTSDETETSQSQMQCSEKEGNLSGEPTPTLLSIGFEIKPC